MTYRDVITHHLPSGDILVTSCDSCGGIGMKEHDVLQVEPEIVGAVTARVALLEVITLGAQIIGVTVPISNEPESTGNRVLDGVKTCMEHFGIEAPILTSMEKNMPTTMTAVGIVVSGITSELKSADIEDGDEVYVVGRPSVGQEVIDYHDEILSSDSVMKILSNFGVKEVLPVGSMGIKDELSALLMHHNAEFMYIHDVQVDVNKSCGPSTAAIVVVSRGTEIKSELPVVKIGDVKKGFTSL